MPQIVIYLFPNIVCSNSLFQGQCRVNASTLVAAKLGIWDGMEWNGIRASQHHFVVEDETKSASTPIRTFVRMGSLTERGVRLDGLFLHLSRLSHLGPLVGG